MSVALFSMKKALHQAKRKHIEYNRILPFFCCVLLWFLFFMPVGWNVRDVELFCLLILLHRSTSLQ